MVEASEDVEVVVVFEPDIELELALNEDAL
jgi:hypothetical protein